MPVIATTICTGHSGADGKILPSGPHGGKRYVGTAATKQFLSLNDNADVTVN